MKPGGVLLGATVDLHHEVHADRLLSRLALARRLFGPVGGTAYVMAYYTHFISLLATALPCDRDALLTAGRHVFGVTIKVMRADVVQATKAATAQAATR